MASRGYGYKTRRSHTMHDARRRQINLGTIPPELKFLDTGNGNAVSMAAPIVGSLTGGEVSPSFGSTGCLTAPAVGDGPSNRDGKHIIVRSIQVQGRVTWPAVDSITAGSTDPDAACFLALIWDSQCNTSEVNSEDIFMLPDDGSAPELNATPLRNPNFGNRFTVLKSWSMTPPMEALFHDGGDGAKAASRRLFHYYTRCHVPINFNTGTTANVSTVSDKALHLIAFGSSGIVPQIQFTCRIRFVG